MKVLKAGPLSRKRPRQKGVGSRCCRFYLFSQWKEEKSQQDARYDLNKMLIQSQNSVMSTTKSKNRMSFIRKNRK